VVAALLVGVAATPAVAQQTQLEQRIQSKTDQFATDMGLSRSGMGIRSSTLEADKGRARSLTTSLLSDATQLHTTFDPTIPQVTVPVNIPGGLPGDSVTIFFGDIGRDGSTTFGSAPLAQPGMPTSQDVVTIIVGDNGMNGADGPMCEDNGEGGENGQKAFATISGGLAPLDLDNLVRLEMELLDTRLSQRVRRQAFHTFQTTLAALRSSRRTMESGIVIAEGGSGGDGGDGRDHCFPGEKPDPTFIGGDGGPGGDAGGGVVIYQSDYERLVLDRADFDSSFTGLAFGGLGGDGGDGDKGGGQGGRGGVPGDAFARVAGKWTTAVADAGLGGFGGDGGNSKFTFQGLNGGANAGDGGAGGGADQVGPFADTSAVAAGRTASAFGPSGGDGGTGGCGHVDPGAGGDAGLGGFAGASVLLKGGKTTRNPFARVSKNQQSTLEARGGLGGAGGCGGDSRTKRGGKAGNGGDGGEALVQPIRKGGSSAQGGNGGDAGIPGLLQSRGPEGTPGKGGKAQGGTLTNRTGNDGAIRPSCP
jgi:hypothetical protein